jgi:hypothetical protein
MTSFTVVNTEHHFYEFEVVQCITWKAVHSSSVPLAILLSKILTSVSSPLQIVP